MHAVAYIFAIRLLALLKYIIDDIAHADGVASWHSSFDELVSILELVKTTTFKCIPV